MVKIKEAFTLAELLVSLAVIGIIAALTLPTLNSSIDKSANADAMKKAFYYLGEVIEMPTAMGDSYKKWDYDSLTSDNIYRKLRPYLSITKECIGSTGCWTTESVVGLDESTAQGFSSSGYGQSPVTFRMSDGVAVSISLTADSLNVEREKQTVPVFAVDVNGDEAPNKLGDDIFLFVLGDTGLLPAGNDVDDGIGNCTENGIGTDCAARIIREGSRKY